jgi:hypothetical protein
MWLTTNTCSMQESPPAWTCLRCVCKVGVSPVPARSCRGTRINPRRCGCIRRTKPPVSCCSAAPFRVRRFEFSPIKKNKCERIAALLACPRRAGDTMSDAETRGSSLLSGAVAADGAWPLNLRAVLCDLRPRFLAKACPGPGCRRVSRNGRVLLCADRPVDELSGCDCCVRFQIWNRAILAGERPEPYGLLFCVRGIESNGRDHGDSFTTLLVSRQSASGELALDLGGDFVLEFRSARA